MNLISFLVELIVIGVIIWIIKLFLDMLTLPAQIKTMILIVLSLIALLWLLGNLGLAGGATFNLR